jgi:CRISPR/Cas system-associated endonuclease Cas1
MEKFGLETHDLEALDAKVEKLDSTDFNSLRRKLNGLEGKYTQNYFNQIFQLLPEWLRPEGRRKFKAYDGARV